MSLELQLSTSKARQELQQVEKSVNNLTAAMNKVGSSASKFNELGKAMSGVKGINAATVKNIQQLSNALAKLKTPPGLNTLAKNLASLAAVNVGSIATGMQRFSKALNTIKAPANLSKIAVDLRQIATAAGKAATAMERFKAATVGIRTPPALGNINKQLTGMPGKFSAANNAAMNFNNSIRTLRNLAGGLGAALGAFGAGKFVQGATQATMTMEQFKVVMDAVTGSSEETGKAMEFVKRLSSELAISTGTLAASFQKFAAAAVTSGMTMDSTKAIYESFAKSFRVLGLSADDQRLGFLALEQMISKSVVSMEELRRQLGERLPGAFSLAAKAMGKSTTEFSKMVANGEILSTELLPKLAKAVEDAYGKGLPAAMQKTSAALASLESQWWNFQNAFGEEFWSRVREAVFGLATAMESPAFKTFAQDMAKLAAIAANAGLAIATYLVENIDTLKYVLAGLGMGAFMIALNGLLAVLKLMVSPFTTVIGLLGSFRGATVALGGVPAIFSGITNAVGLLRIAFAALMANPVALWITGISAAIIAAIEIYEWWNGESEEVAAKQQELAAANEQTKKALEGANQAVIPLKDNLTLAAEEAHVFGKTFKATEGEVSTFKSTAGEATDGMSDLDKAIMKAAKEADAATPVFGDTADSQDDVSSSSDKATGSLNSAAAAAKKAAAAYRELAKAAREAAKAQAAAGGGGGSAGSGRKGGIAGNLPQTQSVPAGAFHNAPHFADGTTNTSKYAGTLPGGGIPSILHPNEAVIPLSGGRSIPVELKNGDPGTGSYSRLIEELRGDVGGSKALDDNAISMMIKLTEMIDILNGNMSAGGDVGGASVWSPMINSVLNAMSNAASTGIATGGGPTIGGQFSVNMGGSQSGGFSGAYAALNPKSDEKMAEAKAAAEFAREIYLKYGVSQERALMVAKAYMGKGLNNLGEVEDFYGGRFFELTQEQGRMALHPPGRFVQSWDQFIRGGGVDGMRLRESNFAKSAGPEFHMMADIMGLVNARRAMFGGGIGDPGRLAFKGHYLGKPVNKLKGAQKSEYNIKHHLNKDGGIKIPKHGSFAMGSPNAYKDALGRDSATVNIHKDEAIIPLPDGRSVPVIFPEERATSYGANQRGSASSGGSGNNFNMDIKIMANNPLEFEQAQARVEAQMKDAMKRASRRNGLSENYR